MDRDTLRARARVRARINRKVVDTGTDTVRIVNMVTVPPLRMEADPDPDPDPRHTELVSVNRQDTAVTCEIEIGIVTARLADRTGEEEDEEGVLMVSTKSSSSLYDLVRG